MVEFNSSSKQGADNMKQTRERLARDMLAWNNAQGRGVFFKKVDIIRYTGLSRDTVNNIVSRLTPVGGKTTYYYEDIAEALVLMGC